MFGQGHLFWLIQNYTSGLYSILQSTLNSLYWRDPILWGNGADEPWLRHHPEDGPDFILGIPSNELFCYL